MANTTNYNWETPDDTDLVKDGAAAIRTLGSSIDTTTKNLNPQTTTGALAYRSATANVNTALTIGTTGQVLTVAAGVPSWATPAGGGKVLQVVNATHSTQVDSSSTARVDTGLTATITPTLATSKILVLIFQNALFKSAGNSANQFMFKVLRGATEVQTTNAYMYTGTASEAYGVWSVSFLDSPATTSATTYKTTFANALSASLVRCQDNGLTSSIVLMEIGV